MDNPLRKFIARAPRYVLRPMDHNVMRFSLEHTVGAGGIESTILINLSETGCAFLVNHGAEPRIGERIKVEIPVPEDGQIAWWGRVVRTGEYQPRNWLRSGDPFKDSPKILVALRFEKLPEPHSRAIRRGLNRSFMKAMRDQQYRTWLYYKSAAAEHIWKVMILTVLTILALGFIYYFALPTANYDAKRGTPWGDRFKF